MLKLRIPLVPLLLLVVALVPLGTQAQVEPKDVKDVRSGERVLRQLYGTDDLGSLRRRAAEIGAEEVRLEQVRTRTLKARAALAGSASAPVWTSIGPTYRSISGGTATNGGDNAGLTADLAPHPTDPKTLFAGACGGGVWRTTDSGANWIPLTDNLGPLPIGAVAVARSNPSRIYAGTGCGDTSAPDTQGASGFGVILSTDGGDTWRISPAGATVGTRFFHLDVDPSNPDIVLAAGDKGIQRSTDGGTTWKQIVSVRAHSLSRCASNPSVVWAGTWVGLGSIRRSTDGGATFTDTTAALPPLSVGKARAEVAVAPSDPNRVYALFAAVTGLQADMAVSRDGGATFTWMNLSGQSVDILWQQGNYFIDLVVDPQNPDVVYAGGLDTWKTTDAGNSWKQLSRWQGINSVTPYVHADQHAMAYGADGALYFTTDGGIFKTTNGGESFTSLNKGLVTMQFYTICGSPAAPDLVMGGSQDNGTSLRRSGTEYREVVGGDGFGCLIHPDNPLIMHGSVYSEQIQRSTDGGVRWSYAINGLTDAGYDNENSQFYTIMRRNPVQHDTIYTASTLKIWASTNNGTNWSNPTGEVPGINTIRDFNILPTDGSRIAVVANGGQVLESVSGAAFTKIGTVPITYLSSVNYSKTSSRKLYVSSSDPTAGRKRVWVTTDGGSNWTAINSGLPDFPVHEVKEDPKDPQVLWAATYVGLYRSGDGGQSWVRYGQGLPNAMAMAMDLAADGSTIRIGTFGRGFWEIPNVSVSPNQAPTAEILDPSSDRSIEAGSSITFRGRGTDPDTGDVLTYRWDFGDGTAPVTAAEPGEHPFATAGAYHVTLTVTDSLGATGTATRTVNVTAPTVTGASLLLPVVLDSSGAGGSHYTTEVTLASHASQPVQVLLSYTAAAGGGSGFARVTLAPGEQKILSGMISYLRTRGLALPSDSSPKIGTVLATFSGVASTDQVFAGARTFTPDPLGGNGTFGLFYLAARTTETTATLFGLQQNDAQRSNLALVNAGPTPVTLRVALFGPAGESLGTTDLPELAGYGWKQLDKPLEGKGVTSGRAVVTRLSGTSPFTAYGVLNDAFTSDGSFIPPLLGGDSSPAELLVPIVLSTNGYRSELTLVNFSASPVNLSLIYTATPQLGSGSGSGTVPLSLPAGAQEVKADAMAFLRSLGLPIPADGSAIGGSLLVRANGASPGTLGAGARTFISAPTAGTFGLFYTGATLGESATNQAWIHGLLQNGAQRSNLALVNRGDTGDTIKLRISYFGPAGNALGSSDTKTLAPGEWAQFNKPLEVRGATEGYALVERTEGTSRFVAYGVLNDQTNSDGSYIPMTR